MRANEGRKLRAIFYLGNEVQRDMWDILKEMRGRVYCLEMNISPEIEFKEDVEMTSIHVLGLCKTTAEPL